MPAYDLTFLRWLAHRDSCRALGVRPLTQFEFTRRAARLVLC